MNNYTGITDEDTTNKGGSWVVANKDAHEQWNFLNYDGSCYGFVMNYGKFNIERIDPKASKSDSTDGVTVVWCALKGDETIVVGWYENATVYRDYQLSVCTPITGIDRNYFTVAKAEDCYLLPESARTFRIGRASKDGAGKGFGQQNYWFAESAYARTELIPAFCEFMELHRHERINVLPTAFEEPENLATPLSEEETCRMQEYDTASDYMNYLPLAYRNYYSDSSADNAYAVAASLQNLHQFKMALKWYEKVIELEGETWEVNSRMPYLYQQCNMFEKSNEEADKLFHYKEAEDIIVIHELYSIKADNFYYLGMINKAIELLDIILSESTDKQLIAHTTNVKNEWKNLL